MAKSAPALPGFDMSVGRPPREGPNGPTSRAVPTAVADQGGEATQKVRMPIGPVAPRLSRAAGARRGRSLRAGSRTALAAG
eukprot:12167838-Alexandrium_andersonii.AAC.1